MNLTRSGLRALLQTTHQLSYRDARKVVTVIFDVLLTELKKTGTLELPFGTITLTEPKTIRGYHLNKIVNRSVRPRARFRRKDD